MFALLAHPFPRLAELRFTSGGDALLARLAGLSLSSLETVVLEHWRPRNATPAEIRRGVDAGLSRLRTLVVRKED